MTNTILDFAVIGAGMAGASLAAELCQHASVAVIEAEHVAGYHSTGRSAAFWEECYGGPQVVPLTLASGNYLRENGFLNQCGALYIGRNQDAARIDDFVETFSGTGVTIEQLGRAGIEAKVPHLRNEWSGAVWEPACSDIDVAGLHAHYLGALAKCDVPIHLSSRLMRAEFSHGVWLLQCENGNELQAKVLINAAGAWGDQLAISAGVTPIGLQPMRRCVAQLRVSPEAPADLPLVIDIGGQFYFKSDNGRIWLSPNDEVPSEPYDAVPEEIDIAIAIDRFEKAVDWPIQHVERKWAGLRSFAPDRLPVYGRDPGQPEFFWFAGQGGFGIQTAPAAARLAAQRLLGNSPDSMTANICNKAYDPARFH